MVEERALPPSPITMWLRDRCVGGGPVPSTIAKLRLRERIVGLDKTELAISTLVKFRERYVTYEIFGVIIVERGKCYKRVD